MSNLWRSPDPDPDSSPTAQPSPHNPESESKISQRAQAMNFFRMCKARGAGPGRVRRTVRMLVRRAGRTYHVFL